MITPENILCHELIGLEVEVSESTCPERKGIKGVVVDETLNTFIIRRNNRDIVIPKKECKFIFTIPQGRVEVDGGCLTVRPEDRIKKLGKKIGGRYGRKM